MHLVERLSVAQLFFAQRKERNICLTLPSAQIKAVLNNDVTNAGVRWSVVCGSTDCGFFGPVETTSGIVTTYVAPATAPAGGTVQVTATSVGDPTKAISATISITP